VSGTAPVNVGSGAHFVSAAGASSVAATPAGVWACWLGGRGTAADREAAAAVQRAWPGAADAAAAGREFGRAVTWYAAFSRGIRQILDIGPLPVPAYVPGIEQRTIERCQVVRTGSGTCAAEGSDAGPGSPGYVRADIRDPGAVLAAAGQSLDFARPVVVQLIGALDFVADDDGPAQIVRELAAALAPGSLIAVGHLTADQAPDAVAAGTAAWNARVAAAWRPRNLAGVAALFGELPLLLPGLVPADRWQAVPGKGLGRPGDVYGGVAGLPGDPAAIVTDSLAWPGVPA
jgi:S-adenosyl methyltransferase